MIAAEKRAAKGIAAFLRAAAPRLISSRIFVRGGRVTIENLTPELHGVALALNPNDRRLRMIAATMES